MTFPNIKTLLFIEVKVLKSPLGMLWIFSCLLQLVKCSFSDIKQIKNRLRNRLLSTSLSMLLLKAYHF